MIGAMLENGLLLEMGDGIGLKDVVRGWPAERRLLVLSSGRFDKRWARRCVVATADEGWGFVEDEMRSGEGERGAGRHVWMREGEVAEVLEGNEDDPFSGLRDVMCGEKGPTEQGIWMGYLGYELGRWVEDLPSTGARDRGWEAGVMHRCSGWLVYEMNEDGGGEWYGCGDWKEDLPGWVKDVFECGDDGENRGKEYEVGEFVGDVDRNGHEANVRKALDYIEAGDVFEVNVAQRFSAAFKGGLKGSRGLYLDMLDASPSWYGGYMECLTADRSKRVLVSMSPELFLEVGLDDELKEGGIVTRPIKGTRPASVCPSELADSVKDWAELNMVVDMMRNDLGRVCRYGSVRVLNGREIETHPTVHHGVATIVGRLREECDVADLLRAAMPGGSITGAPKVRAMEIIEELEGARRCAYTGAMGMIGGDQMLLNIAIRTAMIEMDEGGEGLLDYWVGGGIVADSVPREEYEETLDKMAAMKKAVGQESIR
ncbi:Aminodeoxychorismate synthase component 1 [Poriferisphaera corsica]|uniref:Aminodeoxychorismate synthase component 1 n=2 Tax=Poriferisphaera corsica TaxID=2528020 RepID=A0A517YTV4_9BACT|nr:Aminodeoxychorismate synthase component 1 [Poriferisphaera corsica]